MSVEPPTNTNGMRPYTNADELIGAVLQLFRTDTPEGDVEVLTVLSNNPPAVDTRPPATQSPTERPTQAEQAAKAISQPAASQQDTSSSSNASLGQPGNGLRFPQHMDPPYMGYYYRGDEGATSTQVHTSDYGYDADSDYSSHTQYLTNEAGLTRGTESQDSNPPRNPEYIQAGFEAYANLTSSGMPSPPPTYATSLLENHAVCTPSGGAFKYEAAYMNQLEGGQVGACPSSQLPIRRSPAPLNPNTASFYPRSTTDTSLQLQPVTYSYGAFPPPSYPLPTDGNYFAPRPTSPSFFSQPYAPTGQSVGHSPPPQPFLMLSGMNTRPGLLGAPPVGPPLFPGQAPRFRLPPGARIPLFRSTPRPMYQQASGGAYSPALYPSPSPQQPPIYVLPYGSSAPQMFQPSQYTPSTTPNFSQQPFFVGPPGPRFFSAPQTFPVPYPPVGMNGASGYGYMPSLDTSVTPGQHYDYSQNNVLLEGTRRRSRNQQRYAASSTHAAGTNEVGNSEGQKQQAPQESSSEDSSGSNNTSNTSATGLTSRNWSSDTEEDEEVEYEEVEEELSPESSAHGDEDDEGAGPSPASSASQDAVLSPRTEDNTSGEELTEDGSGDAKGPRGQQHVALSARSEKAISEPSRGQVVDVILAEMQDYVYTYYVRGLEFPYVSSVLDPKVVNSTAPAPDFEYYVPPRVDDNDFFGGQRRLWQERMMEYFWPFFPDVWKVQALPDFYKPREQGWHHFTITSKLRFCCRNCLRPWTSMRGKIHFAFRLEKGIREGFIFMKIFGQVCIQDKCADQDIQTPACYPEEIQRVLYKLSQYIAFVHYELPLSPDFYQEPDKAVRVGNPKSPHRRELCQACHQGICAQAPSNEQ